MEGTTNSPPRPRMRGNGIWMCIDSTSVIWCLKGNASDSSQWAFHNCQDAFSLAEIRVRWSPGDTGIRGNEVADIAANPATPHPCTDLLSQQPTICGIRTEANQIKKAAAQDWWASVEPNLSRRYREWNLTYMVKASPELVLPRSTLYRLLAIRTGHGDFHWYHQRFHHEDAKLLCNCGATKTPEHLVLCRKVFRYLYNWPLKPNRPPRTIAESRVYIQLMIQQPQLFADYLQLTGFYSKVCTR